MLGRTLQGIATAMLLIPTPIMVLVLIVAWVRGMLRSPDYRVRGPALRNAWRLLNAIALWLIFWQLIFVLGAWFGS